MNPMLTQTQQPGAQPPEATPADHAASLDIVVVEDHDLLRQELVAFLQRPGWRVRGVDCASALDEAWRQCPADVLVVDLNLPGEDGISICQRMRLAMPELGIVMLTARTRPSDRSSGYQSGADVYLTKPTHVGELEAVITNLSRRIRKSVAHGLQLDMAGLTLGASSGQKISLSRLEALLLQSMAVSPERQIDSDMLLYRINRTNPAPMEKDNLAVIMSRLRGKISTGLSTPDIIKAIRGYGYQLTLPITVQG